MNNDQRDLIKYRVSRAKETLQEAEIIFKSNHLHGTCNRIYYACFYAVEALLLTKELSASKHSGVIAMFNKHFVKEGVVSVEEGKFYARMFVNRQDSDYGEIVHLDSNQVESDLKTAEVFVSKIETIIRNIKAG